MHSDPWHLWGGNPMMILGQVLERTESLVEASTETRKDIAEIKGRLIVGDGRMTQLEAAQKAAPPLPPHWALSLAREISKAATLREWLTGAALVALALKGVFSPAEIKALLLSAFGIGPQ